MEQSPARDQLSQADVCGQDLKRICAREVVWWLVSFTGTPLPYTLPTNALSPTTYLAALHVECFSASLSFSHSVGPNFSRLTFFFLPLPKDLHKIKASQPAQYKDITARKLTESDKLLYVLDGDAAVARHMKHPQGDMITEE